jgi:hypothetical protein
VAPGASSSRCSVWAPVLDETLGASSSPDVSLSLFCLLQLLFPAPRWCPFTTAGQPGSARCPACLPLCGCGLVAASLTLCGSAFCWSACLVFFRFGM